MLQIKSKRVIKECDCKFILTDATGYKENPEDNGFTPEDGVLENNTDFFVASGNFFNILFLNGKGLYNVLGKDDSVKPNGTYISVNSLNNFTTNLDVDGLIYNMTLFVMSKEFYQSQPTTWFTRTRPLMYYDPDEERFVYTNNDIVVYLNTFQEFIEFTQIQETLTDIQGLSIDTFYFYNICNITSCYNNIMMEYLDKSIGYDERTNTYKCPNGDCNKDLSLIADLEFLRTTISVLRYLLECNNFDDADKILSLLSQCKSICSKYSKHNLNKTTTYGYNGCGC